MFTKGKKIFVKKDMPLIAESKPRKDHSLERYVDVQERMCGRALTAVKVLCNID